jgi:hypothetical protein
VWVEKLVQVSCLGTGAFMVPRNFSDLWSSNRALQNAVFDEFIGVTEEKVDWAYEVWNEVVANLSDIDNHNRAIAGLILCRLALSDPDERIVEDFDRLFAVTYDDRFVTARHCLQSLWRVGVVGKAQQKKVVEALGRGFIDCTAHKNCTLIRYDILECLRKIADRVNEESLWSLAASWIALEEDPKYRKKYQTLWRVPKMKD